jgi:hypothetical protein
MMSHRSNRSLDIPELAARVKDSPKESYTFIYSVMKGTTLAVAAYVMGEILVGKASWQDAMPLWGASFIGLILTYTSTNVGILISNFRLSSLDSLLPFTLGILEFLLFSTLLGGTPAPVWYAVFAVYMFVIFLIVNNVYHKISEEDYNVEDDKLWKLAEKYKDQQGRNRVAALAVLLESLLLGCAFLVTGFFLVQWLAFIVLGSSMVMGIRSEEKTRNAIISLVERQ